MNRFDYYQQMKELARSTRAKYGLATPRIMRSDLRRIYKDLGIQLDLWPHRFRQLRGAYFNDDMGPTIVIASGLPDDPAVFTMSHELKHHLADRDIPVACCERNPRNEMIEIGAEVFAAEFIFPETDFARALESMGADRDHFSPEALVRLKHETRTTLSYAGLAKRAEFLGFATLGSLAGVAWKKLEEAIYGEPLYKRILRSRRLRSDFSARSSYHGTRA